MHVGVLCADGGGPEAEVDCNCDEEGDCPMESAGQNSVAIERVSEFHIDLLGRSALYVAHEPRRSPACRSVRAKAKINKQDKPAGMAAAQKSAWFDHCMASRCAVTRGPTMDPARPTPNAQPTPVARISVGYTIAASALMAGWAPTMQMPLSRISARRIGIEISGVPR